MKNMEYNKGNLEWEIKNKNDENKTVFRENQYEDSHDRIFKDIDI